jgi:hypothetical protein
LRGMYQFMYADAQVVNLPAGAVYSSLGGHYAGKTLEVVHLIYNDGAIQDRAMLIETSDTWAG